MMGFNNKEAKIYGSQLSLVQNIWVFGVSVVELLALEMKCVDLRFSIMCCAEAHERKK